MITRTITPEQFDTIENAIARIDQAAGMLSIMQDALAATDGTPDPAPLSNAAAGIEQILRTASRDLDKLASEILKGKVEVSEDDPIRQFMN